MNFSRNRLVAAALTGLATLLAGTAQASLDDIVLVRGNSSDSFSQWGDHAFSEQASTLMAPTSQVCQRIRDFLDHNLGRIVAAAAISEAALQVYGPGPAADAGKVAFEKLDDCAEAEDPTGNYVIVFTTCSMMMMDGRHIMWWTVPPQAPVAQMKIVDANSGTVIVDPGISGNLGENLERVDAAFKGKQLQAPDVQRSGGSHDFEIVVERGTPGNTTMEVEEIRAAGYSFSYEGDFSPMAATNMDIGFNFKSTIRTDGTAYLAADAPGADVIGQFYRNFRDHLSQAAGSGSLLNMMIDQMAKIAANGVPLELKQGTTVSLMGMNNKNDYTQNVTGIAVYEGGASHEQLCGHISIPDEFEVVDMNEMMAGGMSGGEAGGQPAAQADAMGEAMSAMQEALKNVSPEQKAAMESLGINIPGMSGGAMAKPSAPASAPASSGPSMSAALAGGNLTQTVQNYLSFLGYETGNTDGEPSMETTIAISQFQAEKGLEVTGEISPQLAGILAAEVDK